MTTAPARLPTLADLDRDELLRFAECHAFAFRARDLIWVQWEVACRRRHAAYEDVLALADELIRLARAVDLAQDAVRANPTTAKQFFAAHAAYEEVTAREGKLRAKADRLDRRANRLYALYQSLPR